MWKVVVILAAFQSLKFCQAKTVTYDFNVSWVTANPDGLFDRKVVGINGEWPLPVISVDKGDRLVVNMYNSLGDKNASIHFHGMYQNTTNGMDGPSMVTQCPVPPGASITYNFTVNQNGTYWYHCHTDYCYPDGYRQALIVRDKSSYFYNDYDSDIWITMSDWYHEMVEDIKGSFMSLYNPTGAEPIPNSFLFNDTMNLSVPVQPGKTYLIRLINISAFVAQYFYIEDHTMRIVEIDGVYVDEAEADVLYIAVAQRYSILVTMKNSTERNYGMVTVADSSLLDVIPSNLKLNQTNWLEYNASAPHEEVAVTVDVASDLQPFDDITLVPHDRQEIFMDPSKRVEVSVISEDLDTGESYMMLNNISYTPPRVPTLYTVMSAGKLASNPAIYGANTHSVVLKHLEVVEVVLSNLDTGSHPFHLHGRNFQMLDRFPSYGPHFYDYANGSDFASYNASSHMDFPTYPARRDTFVLPPGGYYVIRFVANNPGVWLFHCHIDWHLAQGLGMVFVEAPFQIQERTSIPEGHYQVCQAAGVKHEGNAAGNKINLLDLVGENAQPGFLPEGFTTRGIIALVFSCISAMVGMGFIIAYGISDLKFTSLEEPATDDESIPMEEVLEQSRLHRSL